ncbi:hypothetical protein CPB84DRAFT_1798169 [Gymnopilus junonius]|uniref:Uncharacterized protein n=1 Tax=Gymnopilus junonius TaxID=109634 RepID=A0A9P5N978_GYMJU|nr:hypothetical protein CPB84DRAFT_1798169 [Gymnopilus junonius]
MVLSFGCMLYLYPQPSSSPEKDCSQAQLSEVERLGNLHDAVISFTALAVGSGITSIKLHCTIPTWSSTADTCAPIVPMSNL